MFSHLFSAKAVEAAEWAVRENDRIKTARILRAAFNLEERYRRAHGIPLSHDLDIIRSRYGASFGKSLKAIEYMGRMEKLPKGGTGEIQIPFHHLTSKTMEKVELNHIDSVKKLGR